MSFLDSPDMGQNFVEAPVADPITMGPRNQSPLQAQAALLAVTQKGLQGAVQSYQEMFNQPKTEEAIYNETQASQMRGTEELEKALPLVLTDPSISNEQKTKILMQLQRGELKAPDLAVQAQQAAIAKPNGQDEYGNKVQMNQARGWALEAQGQWAERQKVVNAATMAKEGTTKKVLDFLGLIGMPLDDATMNVQVSGATKDTKLGIVSNPIYSAVVPGSAFKALHTRFHELSYDEQTAVIGQLTDIIRSSSSLFTEDNQFRIQSFISDLQDPKFSRWEEGFQNVMNALDVIGVGTMLRAAPDLVKGASRASRAAFERSTKTNQLADIEKLRREENMRIGDELVGPRPSARAPQQTQMSDLAPAPATPQRTVTAVQVEALEAQRADLLAENLTPLSKGEVTKLRALREQLEEKRLDQPLKKDSRTRAASDAKADRNKDLDAQIARVDGALEQNAIAERNIAEITRLDNEIGNLRRVTDMEDIPVNPIKDAIQRAFMQGTVFPHQPRTVGSILMNSNPMEARSAHMALLASQSDEVAQAVHGTSRAEGLVKGVTPQVTDATGRVKFVTPDIEKTTRELIVSQNVDRSIFDPVGGIQFSEAEIAMGRANIVSDYSQAVGIKLHSPMTSIASEADGTKVKINAMYSAGDTGWLTPEDAIAQSTFALRSRGVTAGDLTLMARDGDEFVPVLLKDVAGKEGEYMVRLTKDDYVTNADVVAMESLDVRKNFFDRLFGMGSNSFGSLQSHLLPVTSMLHPRIVSGAMVADDKVSVLAQALLKKLEGFSKPYMALSKDRKAEVMQYIEEANNKELKFDRASLYAKGYSQGEVDMLAEWREFWDMNWKLENVDLIRSLNNQKFEWMDHPNFQGAVKPRGKNYAITEVYDAMADVVRPIDRAEIDQIYGMGGNIGELKRPIDVNGSIADFVIVRNNPSEHTRKLGLNDKVLEYREGYYQVHHKAPRFIDETYKDQHGRERTRTIGTTGSTAEANKAVDLLTKRAQNGQSYIHRGDDRGIERGSKEYWDLNTSGGRIAQRHRGDLMNNNVGLKSLGLENFVENPVEAGMRAASSISGRTAMRPVLETAKERFMQQYGHLVPAQNGIKSFPDSLNGIIQKGEFTKKELADARTTWNYINYLENGYVNHLDDVYKNSMRWMADITGGLGMEKTERGLHAAKDTTPSNVFKTAVFSAYLATNPFRQAIVQSNQAMRAFAYNPQGFLTGSVFNYFYTPFADSFKLPLTAAQRGFKDFMESTGMYQAVSKNNLIRGTLMEAAGKSTRVGNAINTPFDVSRKVGFEAGERFSLTVHAAAVYDEAVRMGKNVKDARVISEMHDRTRAITLDMNYAGDVPYNQNALSFLMTYMQVPHKAVASVYNRRIPDKVRYRMAGFDYLMWGMPTETIGRIMDLEGISPENPQFRMMIEDGLQAWIINNSFSAMAGERVAIDGSSLSPIDMDSWSRMLSAIWFDGGLSKAMDTAAGGKVWGLGMDSRMGVALNMSAEFFKDFYEHPDEPTRLIDVLDSWARISSGWTNFEKARMQYALGVAKDKYGNITDSHVGKYEAVAQAFGFGSQDTRDYYKTLMDLNKSMKAVKDQAKKDVDRILQLSQVRTNGMDNTAESIRMHTKLMQLGLRGLDAPQKAEYIKMVTDRLVDTPENQVMKSIVKSLGFPDSTQIVDQIRRAPVPEDQKSNAIRVFQETRGTMEAIRKDNE